jgi:D-glycero-alpha-D-manno-heptose-7-phosphate kinase
VSVHAKAPVRIDFAGGWSDVPEFADAEGGAVANAAITLYTHVECIAGGTGYRIHARDIEQHVFLRTAAEVAYDGTLDLHKAALNLLPALGGVEIITSSDVPAGSGLGASGSLDVALLQALALCRDEPYDAVELAEMGFLLETAELGLLGGRQDQYAAALGGFHEFLFGGGSGVEVRPVTISEEGAADLAAHSIIVYTGQSHFSSQTHDRVWRAYREGRDGMGDAIRRMRDLVGPVRDALESCDWHELARLIDENWTQQQLLDATISTQATRTIESAVRQAGAWGVKGTGAGAGGCLVVVGPSDRRRDLCAAAERAGGRVLEWGFDFGGVTSWRVEHDAGSDAG